MIVTNMMPYILSPADSRPTPEEAEAYAHKFFEGSKILKVSFVGDFNLLLGTGGYHSTLFFSVEREILQPPKQNGLQASNSITHNRKRNT